MHSMKAALLQLDPIVGDLEANLARLREAAAQAVDSGADLLVGTELGLLGYPPRDLLQREGVAEACRHAAERFAEGLPPAVAALVGLPRTAGDGSLHNALALCRGGRVEGYFDKRLLPTYDVFDEHRHFTPGTGPLHFEHAGVRIGVLLCEDFWQADDVSIERAYREDPVATLAGSGCGLVVVASASPFVQGKRARQRERLRRLAGSLGAPVLAVNQVGANDELVFEGASIACDPGGALLHQAASWVEEVSVVDLDRAPIADPVPEAPESALFNALVLGVRDYCRKTGHSEVALGLSGGLDSSLVATIATAALGPGSVTGYLMPSRYSSPGSLEDARELAGRLGLQRTIELPIESLHQAARTAFPPELGEPCGITDENLQARLRGLMLMAHANQTGALVLTTGNKSELAVGYCTLYGDMCGGISVIGDVLKTEAFSLARWLNREHARVGFDTPPIPVSSIEKPPSAELRPDQLDADSLPSYEDLDLVVALRVDQEASRERVHRESRLPSAEVDRLVDLIDRQEYKRHQAPIVLKVSPRSFGRGRPMPIASRWVPASG
ncbi:MAG: NAD+ synthase [Planctomycetota bacterium]|nr:NAD+ synthase [Planctomycetota bacterium]